MLLRIIRGTVSAGREADFTAACRHQVAEGARLPGLAAFFGGYRRVDGADRFVLVSTWDSQEAAARVVGETDQPAVARNLAGIATIESVDTYTIVEPAFRGIVDAPGGVIRVIKARVPQTARDRMVAWLNAPSRDRARTIQHLLLGWAVGERQAEDPLQIEVVAVSAWPSQLVIEAVAEPGRSGAPLYAEVDEFVSDVELEQFRAISLELPEELSDVSSRRVIAARFGAREQADAAASALSTVVTSPKEAQISVAPLGEPGAMADADNFVLVARVSISEYSGAERVIVDQGGDVILSQLESTSSVEAAGGAGLEASFAPLSLDPGFSPAH